MALTTLETCFLEGGWSYQWSLKMKVGPRPGHKTRYLNPEPEIPEPGPEKPEPAVPEL